MRRRSSTFDPTRPPPVRPTPARETDLTLERMLSELSDEESAFRSAELTPLSGLTQDELIQFDATWTGLSPQRRCAVLARMSELGEDTIEMDFTPIFVRCLADRDDDVREQAARALWECDDRAIIRPLIRLLDEDRSSAVRATAAASLGRFAALSAEGKLTERDGERVQDALLKAVATDEAQEVMRRAIESVASFRSSRVDRIIEEAYADGNPGLRRSSIYAMGRTSDTRWLSTVLAEMESEDPSVRFEAANACGALGDESTAPHLIGLLTDADGQVRLTAVEALGTVGGDLARRALKRCAEAEDESLAEAGRIALGRLDFDDSLAFRSIGL